MFVFAICACTVCMHTYLCICVCIHAWYVCCSYSKPKPKKTGITNTNCKCLNLPNILDPTREQFAFSAFFTTYYSTKTNKQLRLEQCGSSPKLKVKHSHRSSANFCTGATMTPLILWKWRPMNKTWGHFLKNFLYSLYNTPYMARIANNQRVKRKVQWGVTLFWSCVSLAISGFLWKE